MTHEDGRCLQRIIGYSDNAISFCKQFMRVYD
ncbi:hypothetical protein predicted by Glimmer/Critica [Lactiplantibacillus plantarum]|nr:hypothetical protein predicted by Glimmer/Critica [Lactiplantibacillus plantarum]